MGGKSYCFCPEKIAEIFDFGQKKPSDFGEDLFFLEITCFWPEKPQKFSISASFFFVQKEPSDFGEDLFFLWRSPNFP